MVKNRKQKPPKEFNSIEDVFLELSQRISKKIEEHSGGAYYYRGAYGKQIKVSFIKDHLLDKISKMNTADISYFLNSDNIKNILSNSILQIINQEKKYRIWLAKERIRRINETKKWKNRHKHKEKLNMLTNSQLEKLFSLVPSLENKTSIKKIKRKK